MRDEERREWRRICGAVRGLGVPEADAEDVANEVAFGLIRAVEAHPEASRDALRSTIVRRSAANYHRNNGSEARRRVAAFEEVISTELSEEPDPEAHALACERRKKLHAMLDQLAPELRIVVQLHALEGEDMRDIAADLWIPEHTGWRRLRLAREALRRMAAGERKAQREPRRHAAKESPPGSTAIEPAHVAVASKARAA